MSIYEPDDEPVPWNATHRDEKAPGSEGLTCVVRPYLPAARGVGSPTLVIADDTAADGLFPVFDQVFTSIWERSTPV
ncbi:DUF5919 domain-containing protein [Sphaerimonospora sp. CA-214678]|uniref:DUF5919 domain-containing protein n=1 Tax=Sphaerimonospora sp. CA-214678 TaxID=3240029 RepID=UPI003D8F3C93